jgi:ABC-type branched-subunit amino acid transport system ATPase component
MAFPGGMVEVLTRHRRSPALRLAESAAPGLPGSRGGAELVVARVTVRFGGRVALDAVELEARPGEVLGVIGANGAGKTTLLDVISGFIRPDSGTVLLNGRPVLSSSPAQRAGQGIGRLVQDPRPFADLSAREVLQLAGGGANVAAAIAEVVATGAELDPDEALAHQSLGTRRLIELAAAALRRPGLLLLDEPTAGLGPAEIDRFVRLVRRIEDTTVVVVEHDVEVVATLASRAVCLGAGRVVATGDVDDVLQDAAVVESFLGPP